MVEVPYGKRSAGNNGPRRLRLLCCGAGLLVSLFRFFPMQLRMERTRGRAEPATLSRQSLTAVSVPAPRGTGRGGGGGGQRDVG